jgi:hypothetical protein
VLRKTAEEKAYTAFVHTLPCVGIQCFPGHVCSGRLTQSHARNINGPTGWGLKENDLMSVAKCEGLHLAWGTGAKPFNGWTKAEKKSWMLRRIHEANEKFRAEQIGARP